MEDETLRLLLIHADKFEYESKEKAVKEPESIPDHAKKGVLQDGLVVFTTVEKGDEASPENTRSEEHTSELQSHHDLVCRLLLEKKKTSGCATTTRDLGATRPAWHRDRPRTPA